MRLTSEPVLHDALAAEKYCEGGNDRIPQKSISTTYVREPTTRCRTVGGMPQSVRVRDQILQNTTQ